MKQEKDPRSFIAFLKWTLKSRTKAVSGFFMVFLYLLCRLYLYLETAGVPFENGVLFGGFWRYLDELPLAQLLIFEPLVFVAAFSVWLSFWGLYKKNVIFKK